jgi:hypothetical protein
LNNIARIDLDQRRFDAARAKLTQAIEWQRKALAANPNHPTYRRFLANHLTNLIRAAEGLRRADLVDQARHELADLAASDPAKTVLDARLASVLKGKETPESVAERIKLAYRANEKALHASSERLFAEALSNDPAFADDRQTQHAYNAACAAALAGSVQDKDDPRPDEAARAKLRSVVLLGNDVVDLEGQNVKRLRESTVFAGASGAVPNETFQGLIHRVTMPGTWARPEHSELWRG